MIAQVAMAALPATLLGVSANFALEFDEIEDFEDHPMLSGMNTQVNFLI